MEEAVTDKIVKSTQMQIYETTQANLPNDG